MTLYCILHHLRIPLPIMAPNGVKVFDFSGLSYPKNLVHGDPFQFCVTLAIDICNIWKLYP